VHQPVFSREDDMSKAKFGATCAAVVLSCAFVSTQTQTTSPVSPRAAAAQSNRGRAPDKPLPNSDAARSPQAATISGCVVRDAGNGGRPTISSNGVAYQLTGKSDKDLQRYLGKRLEVTGTLDSGSGALATSGKTDETTGAPKDQTATAGQSDVPAAGAKRDNTAPEAIPLATDKGTTADLTARIQVKTVKMIAPNCL
jgi:hypothetical protein